MMIKTKNISIFASILFFIFLAGCADKINVVILPEKGGKVGGVEYVDKTGKMILLSQAWESLEIDKSGGAVKSLSNEEAVNRKYGETLAAMPTKPKSYMIFFGPESFEIDGDSKKELNAAIEEIKKQKANLIVCAGHTDSMGQKDYNKALSLKRANNVMKYLVANGVDKSIIEVRHYGDADPLVKTVNGKPHPKNRRVEIIVR